MDDWKQFRDPRFNLVFRYPEGTPQGYPVDKAESRQEESIRIHLTSRDSKELYLEITEYRGLFAQVEYQEYRENLEQRFGELIITDLNEVIWRSLPAFEYTFEWNQGARSAILIEHEDSTDRNLYDPWSQLNTQILSTVEWIE